MLVHIACKCDGCSSQRQSRIGPLPSRAKRSPDSGVAWAERGIGKRKRKPYGETRKRECALALRGDEGRHGSRGPRSGGNTACAGPSAACRGVRGAGWHAPLTGAAAWGAGRPDRRLPPPPPPPAKAVSAPFHSPRPSHPSSAKFQKHRRQTHTVTKTCKICIYI